ncbi:restriction endonuclease [bacterium]|nr:restriction endonuclease [candidate division CSSED10-310 bacterium]
MKDEHLLLNISKCNLLICGDNLEILQYYIPKESVDLIYIDPPFNSKRNYNMFFDDDDIKAQKVAFEDTWTYKNVNESMADLDHVDTDDLHEFLLAIGRFNKQIFPYLVTMAHRIYELHKVLKSSGSFYLHCDPTASHYLKLLCDIIFGVDNFRNEITWKRTTSHNTAKRYGNIADILLFYTKSDNYRWNQQYQPYSEEQLSRYRKDENGRLYKCENLTADRRTSDSGKFEWRGTMPPSTRGWGYKLDQLEKWWEEGRILTKKDGTPRMDGLKVFLDEMPGQPMQSIWTDIEKIGNTSEERLPYPTQKPIALLERIIETSSLPGDIVLDAFCGCGTTLDAAEGLRRRWTGIDISFTAINLIENRMKRRYKKMLSPYEVRGMPTDTQSASALAEKNPNAFQDWWVSQFDAFPTTYGSKGADKGIDGIAKYLIAGLEKSIKVAFQVKGGEHIGSKDIDALLGAMDKHKCDIGIFLTRFNPTKPMLQTIGTAGSWSEHGFTYPRLQYLTLYDFFSGVRVKLPDNNVTFKQASSRGQLKLI